MITLAIGIDLSSMRNSGASPVVTVPVIFGVSLSTAQPRIGEAVTCHVDWTGQSRTGLVYQWRRNGADITGATGVDYTPVASDVGTQLSCSVTVANGVGTASAASAGFLVLAARLPTILLIVAGQSNAQTAMTSAANAPAKYATLTDASMWVETVGFVPYVPGVNSDSGGQSGGWGSEAEFIHQVNQLSPGRAVYVVKVAVNGSTMAEIGANCWSPNLGSGLFAKLEAQVRAARSAMGSAALEEVTLFNQGEGDTGADASANAYALNFSAFLGAYRSRISGGDFVVERIRPFGGDLTNKPYSRTFRVREAQEDVVAAEARAGIISLDFLPGNFNDLHPGAVWAEGKGLRAHARWAGTYDAAFGVVEDTVPEPVVFADQPGAEPGMPVYSASVAIQGLGMHAPVSVVGGEFRVLNPDGTEWQGWGAAPATIHPFQAIQLRVTSASAPGASVQMSITVGTVTSTWTVTTNVATVTHEPETEALDARIRGLLAEGFSAAQALAMDAFYKSAKGSTWWGKIRRLYVGGLHNAVAASIDLRDQTTRATQANAAQAATWVDKLGWGTGGLSGRGLNMQVNPSAVLTQQQSVALFLWCPDFTATSSASSSFDIQSSDSTIRMRLFETGNFRCSLNTSVFQTRTGAGLTSGFRCVSRTGASTTFFYGADGRPISTTPDGTAGGAVTANSLYMFAPGTGSTSTRRLQVAGLSEGLNHDEVLGLRDALAALGAAFWLR